MVTASAQRIVITGATSGIGRELALQYALAGPAVLGLVGRREAELEEVARAARDRGAQAHAYPRDVRDREAMSDMAGDFVERAGGVDLVIANAGTGGDDHILDGDATGVGRMVEINVIGVLNTLYPFVPAMKEQGGGHLVAVASVAGFRALPKRTTYSATKVAVRFLMEGYGHTLERHGILATSINPGFVVSELTEKNEFRMPFLLETAPAAERIRRAIRWRRRVYTFPLPMALVARVLAVLPGFALRRIR